LDYPIYTWSTFANYVFQPVNNIFCHCSLQCSSLLQNRKYSVGFVSKAKCLIMKTVWTRKESLDLPQQYKLYTFCTTALLITLNISVWVDIVARPVGRSVGRLAVNALQERHHSRGDGAAGRQSNAEGTIVDISIGVGHAGRHMPPRVLASQ